MKTLAFIMLSFAVAAQTPQVPHRLEALDMVLVFSDEARDQIQADVDMLTQYPTSFDVKVARARMYFPLIEEVLKEEHVPDDIKYLVLQESALIPDAVSTSNAVGFWQFKDYTALEMGLRVDKNIDERMNIIASTQAAAQYIKKNNYYFNNWIYAIQAYYMGAGDTRRAVKDPKGGAKQMNITGDTFWYVKRFLAHKIAFEEAIKIKGANSIVRYDASSAKSISQLALELKLDENELLAYNKWTKNGEIPAGMNGRVIGPLYPTESISPVIASATKPVKISLDAAEKKVSPSAGRTRLINGIPAIQASAGDRAVTLAQAAGISLTAFLKYNDMSISDPIRMGDFYYTRHKQSKIEAVSHVALDGENLWRISQEYGIRLSKLKRLNDGAPFSALAPGTTVWLSSPGPLRPKEDGGDLVVVDDAKTFSWSVNPDGNSQNTRDKKK